MHYYSFMGNLQRRDGIHNTFDNPYCMYNMCSKLNKKHNYNVFNIMIVTNENKSIKKT